MTIHELVTTLNTMDPDHDVFVALCKTNGTGELFDIEAVHDHHDHTQLDIYEEEAADAEMDGPGMPEAAEGSSEAAQAAIDAFLDFCVRRGITEEEKDLIWNAMAFICCEQVQGRQGPFYDAIQPLMEDH
jgi:hypothetical protein